MRRAGVAAVLIVAVAVIAWWRHARSHAASDAGTTTHAPEPVDPRVAPKLSSIGGRVTRASDGAAIANASVGVELVVMERWTTPAIVRTNAIGEWMLLVAAGNYRVAVTAVGFVPQRSDRVVVARGETSSVSMALEAGGSVVRGMVSDLGGGPIAGATACVVPFCAVTDVEGHYTLAVNDGAHYVDVSDEDYCSNSEPFVVSGADATVDVQLVPGAAIRGDVRARDTGLAIPGAAISVARDEGIAGRGITEDDGNFTIRQLQAGRMFVSARAPGYASRGETGIEVGPGETAGPIHVVLDRAFSINGLVVRKENTQPASGLTVHAFIGTARGADVSTTTRADGTFTIDGLMPGLYGIEIFDGDSLRLEGPPVEVRDRDVIDQLYAVARGVTIRGRVEPAGVMRVTVAGDETTTKIDGTFAFHNLLPGTNYLSASNANVSGSLSIEVGTSDLANLVISTKASSHASVSGSVLDQDGVPVASAMVSVEGRLANTDAAGHFTVTGLTPGKSMIAASRDIPVFGKNLKYVDAPSTNNIITIESRHSKITGRVVQADKQPAADILVTATRLEVPDDGVSITHAITAADGTFTLVPLSTGVYTLSARDARYNAKVEVPRAHSGDSVTITLDPLSSLGGHVTVNGAPVAQFELRCGFGELHQNVYAPDGAFQFDHVQPGFYTCKATSKQGVAEASITVGREPAQLELPVRAYASATGTLVNAFTGKPVAGLLAYTDQVRNNYLARGAAISDAAGHFVVDPVVAGDGAVQISVGDFPSAAQTFARYTAGDGARVDLGEIRVLPARHGKPGTFGMKTRNLEVVELAPDGPAALAGIRTGDTIEEVEGISAGTLPRQVLGALIFDELLTVGDTYHFTLGRGVTVTLVAN